MQSNAKPEVRVLDSAENAVPVLLDELRNVIAAESRPLVSFATGVTFTAFFRSLDVELKSGRIDGGSWVGTHLDEYIAFEPNRRGGMVHELTLRCPALREMLARGSFLPVPCHGAAGSLRAHEERMQRAGGVKLQFLGIGRNGHVAFNEPGAPIDSGFHVTTLAESTRRDAAPTFVPDEPPRRAVTAGLQSILGAERIVLCAFGSDKADAVRAMLHDESSERCPASALRDHPNALVLLDPAAASSLDTPASAAS